MSVIPRFPSIPIRRQDEEEETTTAAATTTAAQTTTPSGPSGLEPETFYTPIYIVSGFFWAIFIFGPLFVRKGPNAGITRCCIMLTAFTLWLFWVTIYIGQMNPLLGPRLHNCSLAWVGYKWGKDPKSLSTELEETEF